MKKLIAILFSVVVLSGCTGVDVVSTSVNYYCSLPQEVREVNRNAVYLAVAPNTIEIWCYHDS